MSLSDQFDGFNDHFDLCSTHLIILLLSNFSNTKTEVALRERDAKKETYTCRPFRSWNREASILCSSFVLFLCLCALSLYFLSNGLLSIFNVRIRTRTPIIIEWQWNAMFALRMHYYAFSFPISLLNPWCLLLTSGWDSF